MVVGIHRLGAFRAREQGAPDDLLAIARAEPAAASAHPVMSPLARASTLARLGELDAATRVLEDLGPGLGAEVRAFPLALATLADVAARVGDRDRAAALLPALEALEAAGWRALTWGAVGYIWDGPLAGVIGSLLSVLERWSEAVPRLESALAAADACGARPSSAELRRALAVSLARGRA
jgi:hypothetical protein